MLKQANFNVNNRPLLLPLTFANVFLRKINHSEILKTTRNALHHGFVVDL